MTRLTVIVPATDDPPTLGRCLAGLAAAPRADQVIVVREPAGDGPSAARNRGARLAGGDVLVFVNADVVVHADALSRIREAFAGDPSLTAVFGAYDAAPAAPGVVSRFRNLLHHHVHHQAAGPAGTFWSGLGAVRRDAFAEVGGFDEVRHPRYVEDVDLGMRLIDAGARILLDPAIAGSHLKRWTIVGMVRTDLVGRGVPWVRLLLRRGGGSSALNLGWRHRISTLASLAVVGGTLARRPAVAAAGLATLGVANRDFYALLSRRLGPAGAVAGVGLHVVHHVTAAASVPIALVLHLGGRP